MQTIFNGDQVIWDTGNEKKLFVGKNYMRKRQTMVDGLVSSGRRSTGVTVKVTGAAEQVNEKTFRQLFASLLRDVDNVADFLAVVKIEAGPKLRAAWHAAVENGIDYYAQQKLRIAA